MKPLPPMEGATDEEAQRSQSYYRTPWQWSTVPRATTPQQMAKRLCYGLAPFRAPTVNVPILPTMLQRFQFPSLTPFKPSSNANDLRAKVVDWVVDHTPPNTIRTYATPIKEFDLFCKEKNLQQFPASDTAVAAFAIHMHEQKYASNSISTAISAISSQYKLSTFASPTKSPLVTAVKNAIKKSSPPAQAKLPLTIQMLRDIAKNNWSSRKYIDIRDTFMMVLAMNAFLRESETVSLEKDDVWLDTVPTNDGNKQVIFVFIEKSKTDSERRGATIVVGKCKDSLIDPITWFEKYSRCRRSAAKQLFHHNRTIAGLKTTTPNGIVKKRLKQIKIDPELYGSHSLRSGGVTAAAEKNIEISLLKKHGRWKSDVIYNYIRDPWSDQLKVRIA
eukprot:TRINITY_DN493_c0_g1_i1.p1 TRINITY_DN493_c0_g1~~TRINITY_DN493_c0_g1_i1.p1  ORF type:complete len:389 (+),score=32.54 TRINITY_DN493_c0_g1_i1:126-1292(+)